MMEKRIHITTSIPMQSAIHNLIFPPYLGKLYALHHTVERPMLDSETPFLLAPKVSAMSETRPSG